MLKALLQKNAEKLMEKYRIWLGARADLSEREKVNAKQPTNS